jgi:hypothetical protein
VVQLAEALLYRPDGRQYESQSLYSLIYGPRVERRLLLLPTFTGLLFQPWITVDDDCGGIGGMNDWQGKTYSGAALPTTDST